jgi:glycosyltransferase involved in cell wall biosynthesis
VNSLLTIGITLHNSAKYLPNLYNDLSAGLKNPQLDILFVDDGSSDESFDLAKSLFGNSCRFIRNIVNLGVSESRNKII